MKTAFLILTLTAASFVLSACDSTGGAATGSATTPASTSAGQHGEAPKAPSSTGAGTAASH